MTNRVKRNLLFKRELEGEIFQDAVDVFRLVLKNRKLTVVEKNRILAFNSQFRVILRRKFKEASRAAIREALTEKLPTTNKRRLRAA